MEDGLIGASAAVKTGHAGGGDAGYDCDCFCEGGSGGGDCWDAGRRRRLLKLFELSLNAVELELLLLQMFEFELLLLLHEFHQLCQLFLSRVSW